MPTLNSKFPKSDGTYDEQILATLLSGKSYDAVSAKAAGGGKSIGGKPYSETRLDALSLIGQLDKIETPVYSKALSSALKFGDPEVAKALIEKGADIDAVLKALTQPQQTD